MLVSHRNTLEMENVVFAIAAVVWVGESDYNSCRAIIDAIKWKKYLFLNFFLICTSLDNKTITNNDL